MRLLTKMLFSILVVGILVILYQVDWKSQLTGKKEQEEVSSDPFYLPPMIMAVREKDVFKIRKLIREGTDVNQQYEGGVTALNYIARYYVSEDSVQYLLQNNADPNIADILGNTPLHTAIESNYSSAKVKLLLQHHADPNKQNDRGNTPLHLALGAISDHSIDYNSIFAICDAKANVNIKNKYGATPLIYACENCDTSIINRIIELGAELDATDEDGWAAIHYAVYVDDSEAVALLLEKGADANIRTRYDDSPLFLAVNRGCDQSLAVLKEHKINEPSWTKLHWAVIDGDLEAVKNIISDKEIDLNQKDRYGRAPLVWAAHSGFLDITKTLVENGADADITNEDHYTPFLAAINYSDNDLIKYLKSQNPDIHVVTDAGWNALHYAVGNEDLSILEQLIAEGVNIHQRDNSGYTLLHKAVKAKNTKAINLLLKAGVNPLILDNDGDDCLYWVEDSFKEDEYKKLIMPYQVRTQEEINARVLLARAESTLPKSKPHESTTPEKALLQYARAINQNNRTDIHACHTVEGRSTEVVEQIIRMSDTIYKLRRVVIREYGKDAWIEMLSNGDGFSFSLALYDEERLNNFPKYQLDDNTVSFTIPSLATRDGLVFKKDKQGLWKIEPECFLINGASYEGFLRFVPKLIEEIEAVIENAGAEGVSAHDIDQQVGVGFFRAMNVQFSRGN